MAGLWPMTDAHHVICPLTLCVYYISLVGGIPTPLKNMSSSVGMMTFPIYGKIKNVPNHQPVIYVQLACVYVTYIYIYICIAHIYCSYTLPFMALHCTTLPDIALHYFALQSITLQYHTTIVLHYIILHNI